MKQPNPKQLERLKRVAKIVKGGDLAIAELVFDLEDKVDSAVEESKKTLPTLEKVLEHVKGQDGVDGGDGKNGEDGADGKPGKDGAQGPIGPAGKDGADGRPGKDGESVVGPPGKAGKDGKDGKDGSPDLPMQVAEKLNTLEGAVEGKVIKGWNDLERNVKENLARPSKGFDPAMGPSFADIQLLKNRLSTLETSGGDQSLIEVIHKDGTRTAYNSAADTDVSRGTALLSAIAAAVIGDVFYLTANVFDIGNNNIDLSTGFSIFGSGKYKTIIQSSYAFSTSAPIKQPIIVAASNREVRDLSIVGTAAAGTFQACYGSINGTVSNAIVANVYAQASTDIIYFNGISSGSYTAKFFNLTTASSWDSVVIASVSSGSILDFYDCELVSTATGTINGGQVARGVVANSNGGTQVVNLWNTTITTSAATDVSEGIAASVNSTVNVSGGSISTSGSGSNIYDLFQTSSGAINVGADVSYTRTKTVGTITSRQSTSMADSFVASSASASSTFAGKVGIGTTAPAYTYTMGDAVADLSGVGSLTGVIDYDGSSNYFADGNTQAVRVYPYRLINGTPYYSQNVAQSSNVIDDSSAQQYSIDWSWSASANANGYILVKYDSDNQYFFDQYIDVGNVTSFHDDDAGNFTNFGGLGLILPYLPYAISGSEIGFGTTPTTNVGFKIHSPNDTVFDITSPSNGTAGNQVGTFVVRNATDGLPRIRQYEASNNGTYYGTFEVGASTTKGTDIIGEVDILNWGRSASDKRLAGVQGLTGATKDSGSVVMFTSKTSGASVINFMGDAQTNGNGIGYTGAGYVFPASTLGVYGSMTVGISLYGTAAPIDGLLVKGAVSGSMDTMTYATTISLDVTKGNLHKTTTVNATGNATINASAAGTAGQHIWVLITNDATSGKVITFGTNFKPNGTLTGTASKSATVHFVSDGSNWYEVARTLLL